MRKVTSSTILTEISKSYKLENNIVYQGIPISIENRTGTVRFGKDKNGAIKWRTVMRGDYGYFTGTIAESDGDALDVYVRPAVITDKVFIVHQKNPETGSYDECKVLLGFRNREEAVEFYKLHYDDPSKFMGPVTEMDIDRFKRRISGKNRLRLPPMISHRAKDRDKYNLRGL